MRLSLKRSPPELKLEPMHEIMVEGVAWVVVSVMSQYDEGRMSIDLEEKKQFIERHRIR